MYFFVNYVGYVLYDITVLGVFAGVGGAKCACDGSTKLGGAASRLRSNMSSATDTACYVNYGSSQAFSSSLLAQQREDVLQSTLLAQILADEQYSREDERWYDEHFRALRAVGWSIG